MLTIVFADRDGQEHKVEATDTTYKAKLNAGLKKGWRFVVSYLN